MNFNKKSIVNYKANPLTTVQRNALTGSLNSNDIGLTVYDTDLKTLCHWNGTQFTYNVSDTSPTGSVPIGKFVSETIDIASAPVTQILIAGTGQDNFGVISPLHAGVYNSFGFWITQGYAGNTYIKYGLYDKSFNLLLSHVQQYPTGITTGQYNVMFNQSYTLSNSDFYYQVIGQWNPGNQQIGFIGLSGVDPNNNAIKFSFNGGANSGSYASSISSGRANSGVTIWNYIKYS